MTSPSIQTAIAQARAAAVAVTPGQGEIVPFGRPISLMDNLVGSFAVDTWLKVKPYGMTIGKDTTTLFDKLPFRIDLSTVVYCRRIRYGNPAEYRTTYDGLHDFRGGHWTDTVARARSIDPKCQGDYRSADIPLIAAEDIVAKDGTVLDGLEGWLSHRPSEPKEPQCHIAWTAAELRALVLEQMRQEAEEPSDLAWPVFLHLTPMPTFWRWNPSMPPWLSGRSGYASSGSILDRRLGPMPWTGCRPTGCASNATTNLTRWSIGSPTLSARRRTAWPGHYSRDADLSRKMTAVAERMDVAENKRRSEVVKPT
jgi:hypothetical protein